MKVMSCLGVLVMLRYLFIGLLGLFPLLTMAMCEPQRVMVQVLGSGGPELNDGRASTSYLLWLDNKATVLVDVGPGSSVNFGKTGADIKDVAAILLTHLHVDHSADLPAFVKGSYFSQRDVDLPLYGPSGNQLMPATTEWLAALFGENGVYRYLSDYMSGEASYRLNAIDVPLSPLKMKTYAISPQIELTAMPVHHGPVAAVAWRVTMAGCTVTFSGDMNDDFDTLSTLAEGSDVLVMHNAVPETAKGAAAHLHMTPSQIGRIVEAAQAKQVIISHRMRRTNDREASALAEIRRYYDGRVLFADDLDNFIVGQ